MGRIKGKQHPAKRTKEDLFSMCYDYLRTNFHKFDEVNKVKIALEIVKRSIPDEQKITGQMESKITVIYPDSWNKKKADETNP